DALVCQLLEKEPGKRPADAAVVQRRLETLRRKQERRADPGPEGTVRAATVGSVGRVAGPGEATLMSRLMREELEAQNRGGPVKRFFNNPLVLVSLFILCVGLLVWPFLPSSPETLFRRGAELMKSDDPD